MQQRQKHQKTLQVKKLNWMRPTLRQRRNLQLSRRRTESPACACCVWGSCRNSVTRHEPARCVLDCITMVTTGSHCTCCCCCCWNEDLSCCVFSQIAEAVKRENYKFDTLVLSVSLPAQLCVREVRMKHVVIIWTRMIKQLHNSNHVTAHQYYLYKI